MDGAYSCGFPLKSFHILQNWLNFPADFVDENYLKSTIVDAVGA